MKTLTETDMFHKAQTKDNIVISTGSESAIETLGGKQDEQTAMTSTQTDNHGQ